jgi:Family of unknown function (DUF6082)
VIVIKRIFINRLANPLVIRVGILVFAAIMLAVVIVSPFALQRLALIHGVNWARLSDVGQTYGAVSAFLTALALGGVVISLIYQGRELRTAREQANSTFHNELLKMEMENPVCMDAMGSPWGAAAGLTDYDSLRRHHFVHMWVSYWESQYKLREISDPDLRFSVSSELFVSASGRRYWSTTRAVKLKYYKGRLRQCTMIIDEEYRKAIAEGPPVTTSFRNEPDNGSDANSQHMSPAESRILICATVGAAILAGHLLGRRFPRRSQ